MVKIALLAVLAVGAIGVYAVRDLRQPSAEAAVATALFATSDAAPGGIPVAEVTKVTLQVEGMTCAGCAIASRTVLRRLEGVEKAEVSYEKSSAVVTYDPEKASVEQMVAALKKLGYRATLVPE